MSTLALLADTGLRALALGAVVAAGLAICRVRRPRLRLFVWTIVLYAAIGLALVGRTTRAIPVAVPASIATVAPIAVTATVAPATPEMTQVEGLRWTVIAAAIYVAGVVWLVGRILLGWLVTRRLARAAKLVGERRALDRLAHHARLAGLTRLPRLVESDRLFVPLATGIVSPTIVLPSAWGDWDDTGIDAVLAHEVAHIARRDVLVQRVSLIYRAIFWPSPLGWWMHRELTELAELASDEAALDAGVDPASYAERLLEFFTVRPAGAQRADWTVAMARGATSSAGRRIDLILAWETADLRPQTRARLTAALIIAPLLVLAASIEPVRQAIAAAPGIARRVIDELAAPPATVPPARAVARPAPIVPPPATAPSLNSEPAPAVITETHPSAPAEPAPIADVPARTAPAADVVTIVDDPAVIRRVPAKYTAAAMEAGIQGVVWLDAVIRADGSVGDVTIVKSLDAGTGLDAQAVAAARQWRFTPAAGIDPITQQRVAVPTTVRLELDFRLR